MLPVHTTRTRNRSSGPGCVGGLRPASHGRSVERVEWHGHHFVCLGTLVQRCHGPSPDGPSSVQSHGSPCPFPPNGRGRRTSPGLMRRCDPGRPRARAGSGDGRPAAPRSSGGSPHPPVCPTWTASAVAEVFLRAAERPAHGLARRSGSGSAAPPAARGTAARAPTGRPPRIPRMRRVTGPAPGPRSRRRPRPAARVGRPVRSRSGRAGAAGCAETRPAPRAAGGRPGTRCPS